MTSETSMQSKKAAAFIEIMTPLAIATRGTMSPEPYESLEQAKKGSRESIEDILILFDATESYLNKKEGGTINTGGRPQPKAELERFSAETSIEELLAFGFDYIAVPYHAHSPDASFEDTQKYLATVAKTFITAQAKSGNADKKAAAFLEIVQPELAELRTTTNKNVLVHGDGGARYTRGEIARRVEIGDATVTQLFVENRLAILSQADPTYIYSNDDLSRITGLPEKVLAHAFDCLNARYIEKLSADESTFSINQLALLANGNDRAIGNAVLYAQKCYHDARKKLKLV